MEAFGIGRKLWSVCLDHRSGDEGPQAGPFTEIRNRGADTRPWIDRKVREGDRQKSDKFYNQRRHLPLWNGKNDAVPADVAEWPAQLSAQVSNERFRRVEPLLCSRRQR